MENICCQFGGVFFYAATSFVSQNYGARRSDRPFLLCQGYAILCGLRLVWTATVFRADPCPESIYVAYPITWVVITGVHLCTLFVVRRRAKRSGRKRTAFTDTLRRSFS